MNANRIDVNSYAHSFMHYVILLLHALSLILLLLSLLVYFLPNAFHLAHNLMMYACHYSRTAYWTNGKCAAISAGVICNVM